MFLEKGKIEPGKRIGDFVINSKKVDNIIIAGKPIEKNVNKIGTCTYIYDNYMLWFDEQGLLKQVAVTKGFLDGFNGIHIGSTVQDLLNRFGTYGVDEFYVIYYIPEIEGISFGIEDVGDEDDDEWDELAAPIEWIYVYRVKD